MKIINVYGPPASGKTLNAVAMKRYFKAHRIVDNGEEFLLQRNLRKGDLVLTQQPLPLSIVSEALDIRTVLSLLGRQARLPHMRKMVG